MALQLANLVILHVPKTGSAWTRLACFNSVAAKCREIGEWHATLAEVREQLEKQRSRTSFIGTFVRHPLAWYRSAWTYWKETGRFPRAESDAVVEDDNFEVFVRKCLEAEPHGYVSSLYRRYTGALTSGVMVGRQEQLQEDLITFLWMANEPFDEHLLRNTPPHNVRGSRDPSMGPLYSAELRSAVLEAESEVIERHYSSSKWTSLLAVQKG